MRTARERQSANLSRLVGSPLDLADSCGSLRSTLEKETLPAGLIHAERYTPTVKSSSSPPSER